MFSWPSAKVSVMGPDQLQSVMETVSSDAAKTQSLKAQIEAEGEAVFGSARLSVLVPLLFLMRDSAR